MTNDNPAVTVVIPCYNMGAFIEDAVNSVLAQTFDGWELIIVDDGSDDPQTVAQLDSLAARGIKVLHSTNCGVAAARNRGIEAARGRYILPLDADDLVAPSYLEQAVAVLEVRPEVGIVYCRAELIGAASGQWALPGFSVPHLLLDNPIFSAALYRRDDWLAIGGYRKSMRYGWEDWDYWLGIVGLGREVVRLPEILFSYRIRAGSRDRTLGLVTKCILFTKMASHHHRLFREHLLNIIKILVFGKRRKPPVIRI